MPADCYNGRYKAALCNGKVFPMSAPLVSPEFGTLYVGDTNDDDGQVIDSLVQEVDTPADKIVQPIDPEPLVNPKKIGRLLTGTLVLNAAEFLTPTMIVPQDDNRIHLHINAYSYAVTPAAKDHIYIADENGKASGTSMAYKLRHAKSIALDDYTGAVWAFPGALGSDNFEISWIAVTS